MKYKYFILIIALMLFDSCGKINNKRVAIIPQPQHLKVFEGETQITPATKILLTKNDEKSKYVLNYLENRFETAAGFKLQKITNITPSGKNIISLNYIDDNKLGTEGYRLKVNRNGVKIFANTANGLFYGVQTILQLLPPAIYSNNKIPDVKWKIPFVEIRDKPRFKWRGMMLDVVRHFFDKKFETLH